MSTCRRFAGSFALIRPPMVAASDTSDCHCSSSRNRRTLTSTAFPASWQAWTIALNAAFSSALRLPASRIAHARQYPELLWGSYLPATSAAFGKFAASHTRPPARELTFGRGLKEPVLLCFAFPLGLGERFDSVLRMQNFLAFEKVLDR